MTDTYRLKEIECDRFRGYAGRTKIHLDAPFVLLSGPNGSGKSSTLNAVEWALLGFDIASKSGTNIDERKDWRIRHDGAESASVTVYFSTSQSPAYVFRKMEGEADKGETKKKEKMKAEYGPVVMEQDAALRAHLGVELGDFYHAVYLHQETVRALMTEEPSLRKSGLDRLLGIAPLRDLVEGVKAAKVASKVKGAGESLRNLEELVKMRASDLQREKEQLRLRARQTWKLELDGIMGSQILEEANRLKVEGASKMRSLDLSGQPSEPPTLALALGPWLEEFKSFIRALPSKAPSGSIRKTLLEKQDKLARNQHAAEQVVKRRREILAQGDPVEKLSQTRGEMKRKEDERTVLVDAQEQFGLAAKVVGEAKRWLEHQGDHHELTCPVCQHSQDQGALRQTIEGELAKSGASQKSLLGKISVLDVELKRLVDQERRWQEGMREVEQLVSKETQLRKEAGVLLGRSLTMTDDLLAVVTQSLNDIQVKLDALNTELKSLTEWVSTFEKKCDRLTDQATWVAYEEKLKALTDYQKSQPYLELRQGLEQLGAFERRVVKLGEIVGKVLEQESSHRLETSKEDIARLFGELCGSAKGRLEIDGGDGEIYINRSGQRRPAVTEFSQGEMNLASMSIFLGMVGKAAMGHRLGFLMLDDPSQNLDGENKRRLAKVLAGVVEHHQVIISTMDEEFRGLLWKAVTKNKLGYEFLPHAEGEGVKFEDRSVVWTS